MNAAWKHGKLKTLFAVLVVFVAVIVSYYPGLRGPFVFDDEIHILLNPSVRITSLGVQDLAHIFLTEDGSLSNRPLAKASLAINYYLSGGTSSTYGYKFTNLAIHLVNAWLVYWFVLLLVRRRTWRLSDPKRINPERVAILVAAIWALHPLHLTTVLYVVQRMTSLATIFVLMGLIIYIYGRQRVHEQRGYGYVLMVAGAVGGSVLGLGCKENAVLILPLMLVIEYVFFGTDQETVSDRRKLRWFYSFFIFIPATLLALWLITHPNFILEPYLLRNFTPGERFLTEPRVLWYYIGLLFVPDVRRLALFHDDIPVSSGLFQPWTTPIALLSLISLLVFALAARRRRPLISFAILWFLIGHAIESSIIGLEIAHEHRNYLPDLGILLAVGYGLFVATLSFRGTIRRALLLMPPITLGFVTYTLANIWSNDETIIESLVRYHPDSARAHYMQAELYAERKHDLIHARSQYQQAAELAPNETGYLMKSALMAAAIESGNTGDSNGTASRKQNVGEAAIKATISVDDSGEMPLKRSHSAAVDNAITEEISDRLKQRPLTPTTLHILDQLATCADQVSPLCKIMYPDIKSWFLSVSQNPHIGDKERGAFIVYLFNMGTARPDLDLSMQAATLGNKFEPSNPVYRLMEANVHVLRGELDTADAILRSVSRDPTDKLTDELREDIKTLSADIELRKAKAHSSRVHQ